MVVGQRILAGARRTERLVELPLDRAQKTVRVEGDVLAVDAELPIGPELDELAEPWQIGRPAAGRQRHDGAFLEDLEAEVFRDARVKHAEAVEEVALPLPLELRAPSDVAAGRGVVAVAVHHEHGGFLEGRDVEHGRMRVVMRDLNDPGNLAVAVAATEPHPQAERQIDDR